MAKAKQGSPADEAPIDLEELEAALEKGEAELPTRSVPDPEELYTPERIEKFIMGEITWAQLHGLTMDEVYNIAQYGYGLYEEGKYHEAQKIFEGLVMANPYDSYLHNMLGAVYQMLDMTEEALESYTNAVELDNEDIRACINRGELLLKCGEFERALSDLKHVIDLDPEGRDPVGIRARALAKATADAMEALEKILREKEGKK